MGADLESTNQKGWTPLHAASYKGYTDIVATLIDSNVNVNATSYYKKTPLHLACERGHGEVIEFLLKGSANIDAKTNKGETPLHVASRKGFTKIVQQLVFYHAQLNIQTLFEKMSPLMETVKHGHTDIASILIEQGAQLGLKSREGLTVLHFASHHGYVDLVKLILKNTLAPMEIPNKAGDLPLHLAVKSNHIKIVKLMIDMISCLELRNVNGYSSLHLAVSRGFESMVAFLIGAGANINVVDSYGQSPLHQSSNPNIARQLIEAGADLELKDKDKNTALQFLCTALHNASKNCSPLIMKYLIGAGANINCQNGLLSSPLHLATKRRNLDLVNILLEANAIVDIQDFNGMTPLHIALQYL